MNETTSEQPTALAINVDQWRSDIKTFAETTIQALNAILAQLSNSCAAGIDDDWIQPGTPKNNEQEDSNSISNFATRDVCQEDRLAQLKTELAMRILKQS